MSDPLEPEAHLPEPPNPQDEIAKIVRLADDPPKTHEPKNLRKHAGEIGAAVGTTARFVKYLTDPVEGGEPEDTSTSFENKDYDAIPESEVPEVSSPDYSAVGKIMSEGKYEHEVGTGGIQERFSALFGTIFEASGNYAFYFDRYGELLLQAEYPQEIIDNRAKIRTLKDRIAQKRKELGNKKNQKKRGQIKKEIGALEDELAALKSINKALTQKWHNDNRRSCGGTDVVTPTDYESLGYPFVHTTILPEDEYDEHPDLTIREIVLKRLEEEVQSGTKKPIYSNGEKRKLYDAIVEIATAYDVPRAIALGIPANESMFRKDAESEAEAKGIYQFTKGGFDEAKKYISAHPEFGSRLRSAPIGNYAESWPNRFVSAELFCAYYRKIKDEMKNDVNDLETRLQEIDPSLPSGTFNDLAAITAYNAGPGRIKKCIRRFIELPDKEIKKKAGEPPYGADVWLALIAHSFGASVDGKNTGVGPDVFMYAQKAIAMGAIIQEEENMLKPLNRDRDTVSAEEAPVAEIPEEPRKRGGFLGYLLGALTIAGAGVSAADIGIDIKNRRAAQRTDVNVGMSRRDLLKSAGAMLALGAVGSLAIPKGGSAEEPELSLEPGENHSKRGNEVLPEYIYSNALEQGYANLDVLYADLARRVAEKESGGIMEYTPSETDSLRRYLMPQQTALLRPRFVEMLGNGLEQDFEQKTTAQIKREARKARREDSMLEKAQRKQTEYIEGQVEAGNIIHISADDASKPYFCEQVGKASGLENNEDNMYTRKEMEKIMGTIVMLVNYQVDIFNANKAAYGITDPNFPNLPHISAIRLTGALRMPRQSLDFLSKGLPATLDLSSHWLGNAVDIASRASANGNLVRLAEDLVDPVDGVQVKAGEKLPNSGYGKRIREIYSHMIGRALFAAEQPLKQEGITIQPLWERSQKNWHITFDAKD